MKKSTRAKPTTFETREEFDASVQRAAELDTLIQVLKAKLARAIQRVQAMFGLKIEPLEKELKAELAIGEKYALAHRKEILPDEKKKKSADTATATFGFAEGKRSVKTLSKIAEENAIALLEANGLSRYVRTTKELAKDKILADCKDGETLTRYVEDDTAPTGFREVPVKLNLSGLRIHQAESFYVKAKTEIAQPMRAEAA